MSGTLYQRREGGPWCIQFTANGRRVRETVGPNKRVAERVLSLRIAQVLENRYFPPSKTLGKMPFDQFANRFLDRNVVLMKSARTERNRVKSWIAHFGKRPLGGITRAEIEDWRREKLATCKPATVNRAAARLRRMLRVAVEWKLLEDSPMAGMKFLKENNARTRYLSVEECERLIASCVTPHVRTIVTTALHSGMRLGEILNLRWGDIDLRAGFILVRDSKNGESRQVPMDDTLIKMFSACQGRPNGDLIFANPDGKRRTDIRTGFKNACRRAGICDLRFHDLRHCYSSLFVSSGGDIFVLQTVLGHKNVQVTNRYAHLAPSYKLATVARMNNVWNHSHPAAQPPEAVPEQIPVTTASQAAS